MTRHYSAIVIALAPMCAVAQDAPVEPALALLASAYDSSEPIADRVTTTVFRDDGTFSTASHTLRLVIGTDGNRELAYEIDAFRFFAEPGDLTGEYISDAGPRTVLVREVVGLSALELLASVIPLGPMPQLWRDDRGIVDDAAIGAIRFEDATLDDGQWLLVGGSPAGAVALVLDADSGRIISLETQLRDGTVSQSFSPVSPGDPSAWRIDPAGRSRVDRADQLAPVAPPLMVGQPAPDWPLIQPDGAATSLVDWLDAQAKIASPGPWRLLLLLRSDDPIAGTAAIEAITKRVAAVAATRSTDADSIERFWLRFGAFGMVVLPQDGFDEAARLRLEAAGRTRDAQPPIVFSTQPGQTIDRLPRSDSVIALAVDATRTVRAIVVLDDEGSISHLLDAMSQPARRSE